MRRSVAVTLHGWRVALAALLFASCVAAPAQSPPGTPSAASDKGAKPAAEVPKGPEPVPLSEVPFRAEDNATLLRALRDDVLADRTSQKVAEDIRALARETDARLAETRKVLSRTSSIDALRRLEERWSRLAAGTEQPARALKERIAELEREADRVDRLAAVWRETQAAARAEGAPAETLRQIDDVLAQIPKTRAALAEQRTRLLVLQSRLAAQQGRIEDVVAATRRARADVESRLFYRDAPAIWNARRGAAAPDAAEEAPDSVAAQWRAVQAYAERQTSRFVLHGVVFALLAVALWWARRRAVQLLPQEPHLADTVAVFSQPVGAALVLSVLGIAWIYPDAPTLWLALMGALAIVPAAVHMRLLIERDLVPVLYALVAFYLVDQVRLVFAALTLVPRVLLLLEALAAAAFSAWLVLWTRRAPPGGAPQTVRRTVVRRAGYVSLFVSLGVVVANALGYAALSTFVGNALFNSAFAALVLTALVEICAGIFIMALHMRPLTLLGMVQRHRALLRDRFVRFLQWLGAAVWASFTLNELSLSEPLYRATRDALTAELRIGAFGISVFDVLAFVAALWGAVLVSRFVRFLLDEEVFARFELSRGLPYAISMTLHYVILLLGFFVAMAALGVDMTKFTILAGAFTVGVGFGLQNIFNNFVSGIILLFERPIKVGDVIQIDDNVGVVERIGIRASVIRAASGSEIIMPNGKLISDRVINWTLFGNTRSVDLPISVVPGSNVATTIAVLERVAAETPQVLKSPAPKAYVVRTGPDWIGVELRVVTNCPEQWMEVRSNLAVSATEALKAEGVVLK